MVATLIIKSSIVNLLSKFIKLNHLFVIKLLVIKLLILRARGCEYLSSRNFPLDTLG